MNAMEHVDRFLGSTVVFLVLMGLVALVELAAALQSSPWRRGHLAANLGLTAITFVLNFALTIAAALGTDALLTRGIGLVALLDLPMIVAVAIGVVALDFATWLAHFSMHKIPAFWRAHRVHHSDPLVDVTTTLRQHPLEGLIRFSFLMAFALPLGLSAQAMMIYRLLSALNALFEHANVKMWRPLDNLLSLIVISPNMHKLHHSKLHTETDSNYGNIFSIFDRIFGTYTPGARAAEVEYGLEGEDTIEAQRLGALLKMPFRVERALEEQTR